MEAAAGACQAHVSLTDVPSVALPDAFSCAQCPCDPLLFSRLLLASRAVSSVATCPHAPYALPALCRSERTCDSVHELVRLHSGTSSPMHPLPPAATNASS